MYKIFASDKCVTLSNQTDYIAGTKTHSVLYFNKSTDLMAEYEEFIKDKKIMNLTILFHDLDFLWNAYTSLFTKIAAAGGVVKNKEDKTLLIYRHNRWDLPKGKMEEDETPEDAAIREVSEECGITKLEIIKSLTPTYHTYLMRDTYVIKKTYWYEMTYNGKQKLNPQLEESITEAKWMSDDEVTEAMKNTYPLIKTVLNV